MNEQDLRDALQAARPSPSPMLEAKVETRLARLAERERTPAVRTRSPTLAAVFALVLCAATAVGAGIGLWNPPLKEMLNITDESRVYEDSRLAEEDLRSVTRAGVTVGLAESVGDGKSLYVAFRVSGYRPEPDSYLYFAKAKAEIAGTESFIGSMDGTFLTRETEDADGNTHIGYADGNRDMMYVLRIAAQEGFPPLDGFPIHVTLGSLTCDDGGDEAVTDVAEEWEFEWILSASEEKREIRDLDLPVGDTGCSVRSVSLTPLGIRVETEVPLAPGEERDEDFAARHPSLYGIRMEDGTVLDWQEAWDARHIWSNRNGLYEETWHLTRVIRTEEAEALIFRQEEGEGAGAGQMFTVSLPGPADGAP